MRAALGACALLMGLGAVAFGSAGCTNNPYPNEDSAKKTLYLPFVEAPKSLDPAVAYDTVAHEITGNVYDTLLEYHYVDRPYRLIPSFAESVPEAEPQADGAVVYRFSLRDDLWFHDDPCFAARNGGRTSRKVTAADFAFELTRIADPAVNSPVIEQFTKLRGFAEFSQRIAALRKADPSYKRLPIEDQYARAGIIEGIRAVDDRHLTLTVAQPYPQLLYWFAMPFTAPVAPEAVGYYDGSSPARPHFADHPVGSGPFELTVYQKDSRMVLAQSSRWYGRRATTGEGPLPHLDRVEFRREKERIPAFNKFLQGYYDLSGIIRESFDQMVKNDQLSPDMAALGVKLEKSVTAAIYYLGFNMNDPIVGAAGGDSAKKLRQALSLATDSKEYCRVFMNGRGVPADALIPPGIFGYDAEYRNPYRQVSQEKARELLAQAGYAGGVDPKTGRPLHLTFDVSDTSADGLLRDQFWTERWRSIGVDVEISATNYNKFQEKVRDGAYQIFHWGWVADYPDAENFLFLLSSEMAASKGGGPNSANYTNPEFDALFLSAKSLPDGAEKLGLIRKMRGILEEDRPWIELFYPEDYTLHHGWISNVRPSGLSMPSLKHYDVEPRRRQELQQAWNRPVLWPIAILLLISVAVVAPGVRTYLKERR